MNVTVLPVSTS